MFGFFNFCSYLAALINISITNEWILLSRHLFHVLSSSPVVSVSSGVLMARCGHMNNKADPPVDCFLIDSCENDNIHKDFRKAIGANCIFYSAQTHELIVLVSTQNSHFSRSPQRPRFISTDEEMIQNNDTVTYSN